MTTQSPRFIFLSFAFAFLLAGFQHGWVHGQMIVAHRGASHDAPENTLAAFRLAWQQHSDGIEGDFYLTRDQEIVCIHDRDTERTGGKRLMVEESTLAQLRELEYGSWKGPQWRGEPIPTLEEVVATAPVGKLVVIELKTKVAIVRPLQQKLQQINRPDLRFLIITFDHRTAEQSKQLMPQHHVHWLTSFKENRPTAVEIADTVVSLGVDGVGMQAKRELINRGFVNQLRQGGCLEFHVWTVDDVDDAKHFQQLGAFGITTNVPGKLIEALR